MVRENNFCSAFKCKRTSLIILVLMFLLSINASAQLRFKKYMPPTWSATIFPQTDGTYRMIYNTVGFGGGCPSTMHFVKLDSACNLIYQKNITSGYCNQIYDVVQKDNEFIIAGFSVKIVSDTGKRAITKLDLEGNLAWHGKYGNNYNVASYTTFAEFAENGSVLGIGPYVPVGVVPYYGIYLYKIDYLGNFSWGKAIYTSFEIGVSSKFLLTNDGGYLIGGAFGNPPNSTNLLIKTNSSGTILWSKTYYTNSGKLCQFMRMLEKNNGEILLVGNTIDSTGNYYNPIIVRCDENGNILESKLYNFHSFMPWVGDNFINTTDFGFVFLTETQSAMTMYKLDKNLKLEWMRMYPGTLQTFNLKQTLDNGYIFASYSPDSLSNNHYSIIKTDKYGHSACEVFDTTSTESPFPVYDSIITLSSINEGFRSPSVVTTTNSTFSISTICFCNPKTSFSYTTNGNDVLFNNTSNNTSNSAWDFGDGSFSSDTSPKHSYNSFGTYTVRLITQDFNCYDTTLHTIQISETSFILFPNPNNGSFSFKYSLQVEAVFYLYNTLGQIVDKKQILPGVNQTQEIQTNQLSNGVYLMKLMQEQNTLYNSRIVIIR